MHPQTFKKIQRDLVQHQVNNTINNTQNIQNNNYNIRIIPLGKEDFIHLLNKETQIAIVNKGYGCIKYFLDKTHFNPDTPQYRSFVITNTQNNIAYIYDDDTGKYTEITKNDLMFSIFDERGNDVRNFIEFNEDDIQSGVIRKVNNFLDRLDTDQVYAKKKGGELKVYIYSKTKDFDMKSLPYSSLNNNINIPKIISIDN